MVKRERPIKEKSGPNIRHDSQAAADCTHAAEHESYCCTGRFHEDFVEVASRARLTYIPAIVVRARSSMAPAAPPLQVEPKAEKSVKAERIKASPSPQAATLPPQQGLSPAGLPLAAHVSLALGTEAELPLECNDECKLVKPYITVEMDNPDRHDTVTEVQIRGWKIDDVMADILRQCWQSTERLQTVRLWNVGLTEDTLHTIASCLSHCGSLRNLWIDANVPIIRGDTWKELLCDGSQLLSLNLRYDGIGDSVAVAMARELYSGPGRSSRLVSLNLSGNRVTDVGAIALVKALRMNRTLLTLNLAGNPIGDATATELAAVISRFPLTHDETVLRRQLLWARSVSVEGSVRNLSTAAGHRHGEGAGQRQPSPVARQPSPAGATRSPPERKDKAPPKKKGDKDERSRAAQKNKEADRTVVNKKAPLQAISEEKLNGAKGSSKGAKDRRSPRSDRRAGAIDAEVNQQESKHPLLQPTDLLGDQLWITGNLTLISVNLQRTAICEMGVRALINAVRQQDKLLHGGRGGGGGGGRSSSSAVAGTGLLRLAVSNRQERQNQALADEMLRLRNIMARRDPKYEAS